MQHSQTKSTRLLSSRWALRAGYMPPGTEHGYKQKIDEMTTDLLKSWTSSAMRQWPLKSYFEGQMN